MYRGTTPTFLFKLPIETDTITALSVTFHQPGGETIEKGMDDVTMEEQRVLAALTEAETLSLRQHCFPLEIQLRIGVGEVRMASQIFAVPVERILKDGAL